MTKHVHDDLKCHLTVEDVKVEIVPKILDSALTISGVGNMRVIHEPETKLNVRMVKAKAPVKKTRLGKVTQHLYDLEYGHKSEKPLNLDLGLYQMENY